MTGIKNKISLILLLTAVFAFSKAGMISSQAAFADGPAKGTGNAVKTAEADPLSGISIPSDAYVFILVDSNHENKNATGTLKVYTRSSEESGWTEKVPATHTVMGRGGMGKAKEGDEKTPLGMFKMDTPFGINDRESGFPDNYLKVGNNHYWSGDAKNGTYNRLTDINKYPGLDTKNSEHLIDIKEEYKYCINIGYNTENTPGKGYALFLHCINKYSGRGTGGCAAVDEEVMKQILKLYKNGSTYILIR